MAIIPRKSLFSWRNVEVLGDLERLVLVLENMPDEALVRRLEEERSRGRDDFPVRATWNSLLAALVFEHPTIASLRRELKRNAQLRDVCGFDILAEAKAVPTDSAYSRFIKKIMTSCYDLLVEMFEHLVGILYTSLPGFGESLAIDGKHLQSFANTKSNGAPDGRRDTDGDFGKKTVTWFGYRLHLIVDTEYELPVAFRVTKASNSEVIEAHNLIDELECERPSVLKTCEFLSGDRGYDDTKLIVKLWDDHEIKPIIDIRNMWQDGERTRLIGDHVNVCNDCRGAVFCFCPETGTQREMAYGGFEQDRGTLKYRCPAFQYGLECKGRDQCPVGLAVRIPMIEDRRVFTPLARSSCKWDRVYDGRTAAERVNSRLDGFFNFEQHTVRGLRKMQTRCCLSLCVMLAVAVGRIRQMRPELMRRLVVAC